MDYLSREQDKLKVKDILHSKTSSKEQISFAIREYFSKYAYKKIGEIKRVEVRQPVVEVKPITGEDIISILSSPLL